MEKKQVFKKQNICLYYFQSYISAVCGMSYFVGTFGIISFLSLFHQDLILVYILDY